jgi:hypothetical protein
LQALQRDQSGDGERKRQQRREHRGDAGSATHALHSLTAWLSLSIQPTLCQHESKQWPACEMAAEPREKAQRYSIGGIHTDTSHAPRSAIDRRPSRDLVLNATDDDQREGS